MTIKQTITRNTLRREMACSALATLFTVMLAWSFTSATGSLRWMGSDALSDTRQAGVTEIA